MRVICYYTVVIGIDEVGRGAWAGPLLVVALRQKSDLPKGLTDSKVLTPKKRQALILPIRRTCEIGEGWVSVNEVDDNGLTAAMKLAVDRALAMLDAKAFEQIIMDGNLNYCDSKFSNVSCIVKADATHPIVSAASIYAKVLRDNLMKKLSIDYPEFGFDKHVGYGTARHRSSLEKFGVTKLHRKSFKPIQRYL